MPVYEYECAACGDFEVSCSMAAMKAEETCPDCGSAAPRVFSSVAIVRGGAGARRAAAARDGTPRVVRREVGGSHAEAKPKAAPPRPAHAGHGHAGRPWMMGH